MRPRRSLGPIQRRATAHSPHLSRMRSVDELKITSGASDSMHGRGDYIMPPGRSSASLPPHPQSLSPAATSLAVDQRSPRDDTRQGTASLGSLRCALDRLFRKSLSMRELRLSLNYPLRRTVLKLALEDARGDRRLAFLLFVKWTALHPTTSRPDVIVWAHKSLLAPSSTTSQPTIRWDAPPQDPPQGTPPEAGRPGSTARPQKGGI